MGATLCKSSRLEADLKKQKLRNRRKIHPEASIISRFKVMNWCNKIHQHLSRSLILSHQLWILSIKRWHLSTKFPLSSQIRFLIHLKISRVSSTPKTAMREDTDQTSPSGKSRCRTLVVAKEWRLRMRGRLNLRWSLYRKALQATLSNKILHYQASNRETQPAK